MPDRNVSGLLRDAATHDASAVALVVGEDEHTYGELDASVDALAAGLRARGLRPGARVAILLPNSTAFVLAYFGALRADAVVVPVNVHYTAVELRRVLEGAQVTVLVTAAAASPVVRGALEGMTAAPEVLVAGGAEAVAACGIDSAGDFDAMTVPAPGQESMHPQRGGEDTAVLLFTSGTTSRPRASVLPHRALLANLDQVLAIDPPPVTSADVFLAAVPFFHVYGLNFVLGVAIRVGGSVVLAEEFDADESLGLVRRHRVSVLALVPRMVGAWSGRPGLGEDLRSVRLAISGAAALPVPLLEEFQTATGITLHQGYGLTEAAPVVSATIAAPTSKRGSIGRPLPGIEVRLVDETGAEVDEEDPGQLVVRGANLLTGYWPDGAGGPDEQGWWYTGDVAYADHDGDLYLVDRIKDLVIVNGFNVYPSEVEDVLREAPGVADAAVVPSPHPLTGEAVKAFVQLQAGASVTRDELAEHCAKHLARFKRPTIVQFVDALPTTSTGKVWRARLRDEEKQRAGLA